MNNLFVHNQMIMNKSIFALSLVAILLALGCNNEEVSIRIDNQTGSDLVSIDVNSNGNENSYGSLPHGEKSEYKTYPQAYRYGFVQAITIAGDTLTVQPIDYVGESPLDDGNYTYRLTVNTPVGSLLGLELVED